MQKSRLSARRLASTRSSTASAKAPKTGESGPGISSQCGSISREFQAGGGCDCSLRAAAPASAMQVSGLETQFLTATREKLLMACMTR